MTPSPSEALREKVAEYIACPLCGANPTDECELCGGGGMVWTSLVLVYYERMKLAEGLLKSIMSSGARFLSHPPIEKPGVSR